MGLRQVDTITPMLSGSNLELTLNGSELTSGWTKESKQKMGAVLV